MDTFLLFTNLFLLLFWVRLWSRPEQELYFNPLLSAPTRWTDRVLDFLRPALPLPEGLTTLLLLVFLLAFRGAAWHHLFPEAPWFIAIGPVLRFVPREPGVAGALAFSLLSFLFFVACYWGVYVLTQFLTPVLRRDRASEALRFAALPLSALPRWAQLLLLLAAHGLLVYELCLVGTPGAAPMPHASSASLPAAALPALILTQQPVQFVYLGLLSVADLLVTAIHLMFALLVGSFAAALLQNLAMGMLCNEGIAALLGTRRRLMIGFLDLTPLLYLVGLHLLYVQAICPFLISRAFL